MDLPTEVSPAVTFRRRARLVLAVFLGTFISARVLVFLIMERRIPDLFLHMGCTHVHHLNYGIFLLSVAGAWLIFACPVGRRLSFVAILYAVGLALTFDEFGMWLHLGGGYWQRASFDAVTVVAAALGVLAYAPPLGRMRARHWWVALLLTVITVIFFALLLRTLHHAEERIEKKGQLLESKGPA